MYDVEILKQAGIEVDKGLELLGDMEMYNSILKEFLDGYYERMKKIQGFKEANDMPNYAIEVHSLKSDSKYLGITKLAELAYNHEMSSKAGDSASVNNHYNELVIEANRVITEIIKYFKSSNGAIESKPKEEVTVVTTEDMNKLNKSILVADDSSIIRDFVSEIFNKEYNILMASDGQEVINIVDSNDTISALLLDLNMPNVNGFEVLDYFKEHDLFKKVPVSIISGSNDKESIDKAFSYDIVDMLNKPFNMNNVKMVVEKTIARKEG